MFNLYMTLAISEMRNDLAWKQSYGRACAWFRLSECLNITKKWILDNYRYNTIYKKVCMLDYYNELTINRCLYRNNHKHV